MSRVLTWQLLRDLKLSELEGAADGWGVASNQADAARDRISNQMINALAESQVSEAADTALERLKQLDRNFEYAYTECGLVRTTLNSLAHELGEQQRRLNSALEDAASRKFTVHPDGSVSYPEGGTNLLDKPVAGGTTRRRGILEQPSPLTNPNPHRAEAQRIADTIGGAVQGATEIDNRFSKILAALKAPPGLAVTTATWTDAAKDAEAVRKAAKGYLPEAIPDCGSPANRKEWWDSLTQEQREELLATYPDRIGNLDGIPALVRDAANRDNLQLLIGKLEGQSDTTSQNQLAGLKSIDEQLRAQPKPGVPPMLLLGIGDEGLGRAIVSFGNPDTARNVSAYVPGLATSLDADFANNDIKRARDTASWAIDEDPSTASIVWLGYDPPQISGEKPLDNLAVTSDRDARVGAIAYNQFMDGLGATNQNANPHFTAIGHSYGSLTVGQAAQQDGGIPGVDDIILVGSPGTGAKAATDLGVSGDHVYVGAAENDPVTKLPDQNSAKGLILGAQLGLTGPPLAAPIGAAAGYALGDAATDENQIYYGTDPAHRDFGAHRFKVDDGPPVHFDGGVQTPAHSNYFNPDRDDESVRNIAKIIVGDGDAITKQEHR
ncbi:alpha/beta hydrolase [Streptomyces albipurpureus]|uniref:Alpha/beta hydrolase family protein n=1 Tax=Streptomyces albipurpureus TaxID=2897419 RepID=A0ABT0UX19_9ACTN|nr:alpha/beta hydrolase [Streptomyces sp. CWNU-1]MCM2393127.1 alpha/beta hydrolase family protein [Streptomyces sp. CWNU-1]